ncbi:MAG: hypothetical protein AABX85_03795 [Nanoarchaeota archaeon]
MTAQLLDLTESHQRMVSFEDRIALPCFAGSYCHIKGPVYVPKKMVGEDGSCIEAKPLGFEGDGFFVNSGRKFYHKRECWVGICEED